MLAVIQCRMFCFPVCYPENIRIEIHRTIIFPFVLYGCETRSLTFREECRLRVFESTVLRRIFGSERDEVTWVEKSTWWVLNELYSLPNIIQVIKSRRMRWVGHVACMGYEKGIYRVLVGQRETERSHERTWHRWEDNIRWIFRKWVGGHGLD